MKKLKIILMLIIICLFCLTGCLDNDSMDNITIVTSVYPVQFVINELYGEHSTINSIYPNDSEVIDFKVTDVLLEQYADNDLFAFNGLSEESDYLKPMLKKNKNLKIIDVTSNMNIKYSIEELWLDPNNLLTIANKVKKGFNEYIKSTYLTDEINENYENLKIQLTSLDGEYYSTVNNSSNNIIIVSDDAFSYLEKYGIEVISLDKDSTSQKQIAQAIDLLNSGTCNYIYIKYREQTNDIINDIINQTNATKLELYTMTNLYGVNIEKSNYITLMNQNLENLKLELYK